MSVIRSQLRLTSIVLAAIAGMVSLTGEATACSAKAARSCCTGSSGPACCCEAGKPVSAPRSIERFSVGMPRGTGRLLAADPECECRIGGPTEPATRPRSARPEVRPDSSPARIFESIPEFRPTIPLVAVVPPTGSPPGLPLYLRASRLRF